MTDPRPVEAPVASASSADETRLDSLLDMTLPVTIEFGSTTMTIQEALELAPGSVIQLDRLLGDPVEVRISDRRLAEAEVVVVGEHFGVRITRVITDGVRGA